MAIGVEFVKDEYSKCARANYYLPKTFATEALISWVQDGGILVPSLEAKANYPVELPLETFKGLRTNVKGQLKTDNTPQIRGTVNPARAIFQAAIFNRTLEDSFRGEASSRPIRGGWFDEPVGIELFATRRILEHALEEEKQGKATIVYLAKKSNADNKGFELVKGGFEAYSSVQTPIMGMVVVTVSDLLGRPSWLDCMDPIADPQIKGIYKGSGIRTGDIEDLEEGRVTLIVPQLPSLAQMRVAEASYLDTYGDADRQYQYND